jgi:hypothetical protein
MLPSGAVRYRALAADRNYQAIVPSDEALVTAFRRRLDGDPGAFARL